MNFINVILPLALEKEFVYSISAAEADFIVPGVRVAVPFGKSKIYTAIVTKVHQEDPVVYEAKPIDQILDENPIVTLQQLKFWEWMAHYYMCSKGEVLRAALPSAFLLTSETKIQLKNSDIDEEQLEDDEFLVFEALQRQSSLSISEIINILNKKTVLPVINKLVDKNVVLMSQAINEIYKPKLIKFIKLHDSFSNEKKAHEILDDLERAPKQREVLLKYFSLTATNKKPIKTADLKQKCGCSSAVIKALVQKNILEEYELKMDRNQTGSSGAEKGNLLTDYQQEALQKIKSSFIEKDVCLLHGITSSGKTEIYVQLIEEALKKGEQVLYLLPEIALTAQLIGRLRKFFGEKILVFHSKSTLNERVEVYKHVLENENKGKIIIGARSAIFLPFKKLGFIIVDEEHEVTFKQYDPAPRYHARDSAIVLAQFTGAKVLLGSASPSIESFQNARSGKYGLVNLNKRYGDVLLPDMEIVDLKEQQKKKKMKGHFSENLLIEIKETLNDGEQVILFQNRRGFSPIMECLTCGNSPQCPNCDVSLTFHQINKQLRCHYCGYHIAKPQKCMACGSHDITTKGFGTEKIETELNVLFPEHKIARMDFDSTRGKYAYEKLITAFEQGEIDILVGTQMLSKGLDFRNVRLVGIMSADSLINFPDFRAHERSFQLMLQVSGRAGRTKKRGKVLIQTYNPYHQIVQQVSTNDYLGMFKEQIEERHQYQYPPFFRLIKFVLKNKDFSKVDEASKWLALSLQNSFGNHVLGPESPIISRIRNEHYKNILLKIPQKQSLSKTKEVVEKILSSFRAIAVFRSTKLNINVDSY